MAGSCNGLQIPCPQCQKVSWDPLPWAEEKPQPEQKQEIATKPQQADESKLDDTTTVVAAKQDDSLDTINPEENIEKTKESLAP